MKTAERRDQMVAAVHLAFEEWPGYSAMPEIKEADARAQIKAPYDQSAYIAALYDLAGQGAIPTGRLPKMMIGGKRRE